MALKEWLPLILDGAATWFSPHDVPAGTRWAAEIGQGLEQTDYGIICLTPENLEAPWLLFEAGAISKALDESRVCPYLFDVQFGDLDGPLQQFQGKRTDKEGTFEMLQSLNTVARPPVDETVLLTRFDEMWPRFEEALAQTPEPSEKSAKPARSQKDILEDLVETVRGLDRRLSEARTDSSSGYIERGMLSRTQGVDIAGQWADVIGELKRRKQALAAAVFGEARVEGFDGAVLTLTYPEDQDFYVGMAKDRKHADALGDVVRPRLEIRPWEGA